MLPILLATATADRVRRTDTAGADEGRVQRYDRGELRSMRVTAEGFVLCEGFVAKPGVLVYRRADGTTVRELIPAEELHRVDSLGTLGRKPLTLEHPDEDVTPDNVTALGVGDLASDVAVVEGGYVKVQIAIRKRDAITAVQRGTVELSPGYSCRLDATPGTDPMFGAYDAIQRDRRYNHVAITEAARGGPEIRLRADSAVATSPLPREAQMHPKLLALFALLGITAPRKDDGVAPADAPTDASLDAVLAKVGEMKSAISGSADKAALQAELIALKAKLATVEQELAAANADDTAKVEPTVEAVTGAIDAAMEASPAAEPAAASPEEKKQDAIRNVVARTAGERTRLEVLARHARIDAATIDKLGLRALRKLVVTTAQPAARKDADDAYYRAAVDMLEGARRDSARDPDPYVGVSRAFEDNTRRDTVAEEEAARRDAADEADPSAAFLRNVNKAHADRFASPAK
jgi:hypothetical protein